MVTPSYVRYKDKAGRRHFTPEFKALVINRIREKELTFTQATREYGIHRSVLGYWLKPDSRAGYKGNNSVPHRVLDSKVVKAAIADVKAGMTANAAAKKHGLSASSVYDRLRPVKARRRGKSIPPPTVRPEPATLRADGPGSATVYFGGEFPNWLRQLIRDELKKLLAGL